MQTLWTSETYLSAVRKSPDPGLEGAFLHYDSGYCAACFWWFIANILFCSYLSLIFLMTKGGLTLTAFKTIMPLRTLQLGMLLFPRFRSVQLMQVMPTPSYWLHFSICAPSLSTLQKKSDSFNKNRLFYIVFLNSTGVAIYFAYYPMAHISLPIGGTFILRSGVGHGGCTIIGHLRCISFCVVSIVCWKIPFGHCFHWCEDSEKENWKILTQLLPHPSCVGSSLTLRNFHILTGLLQREGLLMEAAVLQINQDPSAFVYFLNEKRCTH